MRALDSPTKGEFFTKEPIRVDRKKRSVSLVLLCLLFFVSTYRPKLRL